MGSKRGSPRPATPIAGACNVYLRGQMINTNEPHWLRDLAERLRLVIQDDGIIDEHDINLLIALATKLDEERDRK